MSIDEFIRQAKTISLIKRSMPDDKPKVTDAGEGVSHNRQTRTMQDNACRMAVRQAVPA